MTAEWEALLERFLAGDMATEAFHDRFFALWHERFDSEPAPAPIERLFYVVEAYSPDPTLRDDRRPWDAGPEEVLQAAQRALSELKGPKASS